MTPAREVLSWLGPRDGRAIVSVAMVGGGLGALAQGPAQAVPLGALAGLCLAVVLIDGRKFLIPDVLTLGCAGLGLADLALVPDPALPRLLAAAVIGAVLWGLRAAAGAWTGRTALGLGDVKFMMAAAVWLPPLVLPTYVFAAASSGLVETILAHRGRGRIAFGRHLAPWLWLCALTAPWLGWAIGGL